MKEGWITARGSLVAASCWCDFILPFIVTENESTHTLAKRITYAMNTYLHRLHGKKSQWIKHRLRWCYVFYQKCILTILRGRKKRKVLKKAPAFLCFVWCAVEAIGSTVISFFLGKSAKQNVKQFNGWTFAAIATEMDFFCG